MGRRWGEIRVKREKRKGVTQDCGARQQRNEKRIVQTHIGWCATLIIPFCFHLHIVVILCRILECSSSSSSCLLYTSDAADEEDSVDLGGRRIIKKKKKKE
eukprot:TRINITY_DN12486_c0_g1_i4.p1 TRINITY_DN12486_c0_g1~~TRINITY_DN12486_c0_g1_i4.p1  ORF type:complete len:101 (+),score=14.98 TRINITY_DN12486_c0_g1_i4:1107-1409(+)